MIKSTQVVSLLFVVGVACAPAPESEETEPMEEVTGDEVREEIAETLDAVRGYTYTQREELVRWSRERLSAVEATLAELEEDMENASEETRASWNERKDSLVREREALEERIVELEQSSSEAWDEVKSATLDALETLERGVDDAVNEFDELEKGDDARS